MVAQQESVISQAMDVGGPRFACDADKRFCSTHGVDMKRVSYKKGRVILLAWVDPTVRDRARAAARVSGTMFSTWVEAAVWKTMKLDSAAIRRDHERQSSLSATNKELTCFRCGVPQTIETCAVWRDRKSGLAHCYCHACGKLCAPSGVPPKVFALMKAKAMARAGRNDGRTR
jgi:hypothetical protein